MIILKAPAVGSGDLGDGPRTVTVVVAELAGLANFCNENRCNKETCPPFSLGVEPLPLTFLCGALNLYFLGGFPMYGRQGWTRYRPSLSSYYGRFPIFQKKPEG